MKVASLRATCRENLTSWAAFQLPARTFAKNAWRPNSSLSGCCLKASSNSFTKSVTAFNQLSHWSKDSGHCALTSAKMAKGVHEGIYSPIVYWFCCQYFFTKYNSFLKFLGTRKSKS